MKRERKGVDQWDHSNAMGWAVVAIITAPIALITSIAMHWAILPLWLTWLAVSIYIDATKRV